MARMQDLIVDSFAGGGGASLGIKIALGRDPDIAINHDGEALAMHEANHPTTLHLKHDVWKVDPIKATGGQRVGLLWASPDCKHHSKAKGGKPKEKKIRDLAWVVVRWAKSVRPTIICLENVEEFKDWGPLDIEGRPCPRRKGQTFADWVSKLERLGYRVEYRYLRAFNYDTPTLRKRLYLIARCDGKPIIWPEATHDDPKSEAVQRGDVLPWRTAATDVVDWSIPIPCPSIFLTREEGRAVGCNRPLADATMARIAKGVKRYVIDAAEPFIVSVAHGDSGGRREYPIDEPIGTATASKSQAIVQPFMTKFRDGAVGAPIDAPLPTITANSFQKRPGCGVPMGLISPIMTYAQQGGAVRDPKSPLHTVTASPKDQNGVIAPILVGVGGRMGQSPEKCGDQPVNTITTKADTAIAVPFLVPRYGERPGQEPRTYPIDRPAPTIVPTANSGSLAAVWLAQQNTDMVGHDAREPLSTIVGKGCTQTPVAVHLINQKGSDQRANAADAPMPAATAQWNHIGTVGASLVKYYGTDQDPRLDEPMPTATTKDRFALTDVQGSVPPLSPEQYARARQVADFLRKHKCWNGGELVTVRGYIVVDIGLRMLTPRELARGQGFPDSYILDAMHNGKPLTKTAQTRMVGNSVCPKVAAAIVYANVVIANMVKEHPPIYRAWGADLKARLVARERMASIRQESLFEVAA